MTEDRHGDEGTASFDGSFPPRLHCILARFGSKAIVLRRGPSKRVATFLWDRSDDSFVLGQWLKGRIYERRCDLSPDGSLFLYFAMNGKWRSETRGSWTAVSRTPYLKALDLYAKGDCWEGGGLFVSNMSYWLNDRHFRPELVLEQSSGARQMSEFRPDLDYGAECTGVYYHRLLRDGWKLVERSVRDSRNGATIFEKRLSNGGSLRKIAHEGLDSPDGRGCYWDAHELLDEDGVVLRSEIDWEWAEWDGDSLVWAEGGRLFRSPWNRSKDLEPVLLRDFNDDLFAAVEAPY